MKWMRRNRLTRKPNAGFTASVMTAVPTKSQRTASKPLRMPSASRAGRSTISAVSTKKKKAADARAAGTSSRRTLVSRCRGVVIRGGDARACISVQCGASASVTLTVETRLAEELLKPRPRIPQLHAEPHTAVLSLPGIDLSQHRRVAC